jgi:rabenosyn-5
VVTSLWSTISDQIPSSPPSSRVAPPAAAMASGSSQVTYRPYVPTSKRNSAASFDSFSVADGKRPALVRPSRSTSTSASASASHHDSSLPRATSSQSLTSRTISAGPSHTRAASVPALSPRPPSSPSLAPVVTSPSVAPPQLPQQRASYRPGFQPAGVYRHRTEEFVKLREGRGLGKRRLEDVRIERRLDKVSVLFPFLFLCTRYTLA